MTTLYLHGMAHLVFVKNGDDIHAQERALQFVMQPQPRLPLDCLSKKWMLRHSAGKK